MSQSNPTKAIPLYVITSAARDAKPQDDYVVVRSDNDYQYARTLDEANTLAEEMQDMVDAVAPVGHTVQVVELQEVPPEA